LERRWTLHEKRNLLLRERANGAKRCFWSGPAKTAKELRQGRSSRNIEGNFRAGDARGICRQSSNSNDYRRGDIAGYQMRRSGLVAEVAGLAIRAGFSAMIVPNTAADQREHK
jgi:hypothetical protein